MAKSEFQDKPLAETSRDTQTITGTEVEAHTQVRLHASRPDGWSLCTFEGTISICMLPTKDLRDPYKEGQPVKLGEDPLESWEFTDRVTRYRSTPAHRHDFAAQDALNALKDFIRHHYTRKDGRRGS